MVTIVTRSGKGALLTNTEIDANFTNLNAALELRIGRFFWSSKTTETGALICRGGAFSRTTYADLYAIIGPSGTNICGQGDGSTTFNVLDARGRVLRVVDNGAGVDPDADDRTAAYTGVSASGDTAGSIQDDLVKETGIAAYYPGGSGYDYPVAYQGQQAVTEYKAGYGNLETRMKNMGLNLFVCYE